MRSGQLLRVGLIGLHKTHRRLAPIGTLKVAKDLEVYVRKTVTWIRVELPLAGGIWRDAHLRQKHSASVDRFTNCEVEIQIVSQGVYKFRNPGVRSRLPRRIVEVRVTNE